MEETGLQNGQINTKG